MTEAVTTISPAEALRLFRQRTQEQEARLIAIVQDAEAEAARQAAEILAQTELTEAEKRRQAERERIAGLLDDWNVTIAGAGNCAAVGTYTRYDRPSTSPVCSPGVHRGVAVRATGAAAASPRHTAATSPRMANRRTVPVCVRSGSGRIPADRTRPRLERCAITGF